MTTEDITQLLADSSQGDKHAQEQLYGAVYEKLKVIARSHRRRWVGNETLNTTGIIHEAYLKLASANSPFANRAHFYATASRAMRQIMVNYAERNKAQKRKVLRGEHDLSDIVDVNSVAFEELLTLNQLIEKIKNESERRCKIMECRLFGGMSIAETAKALEISPATIKREWAVLSAWLYREMHPGNASASPVKGFSGP